MKNKIQINFKNYLVSGRFVMLISNVAVFVPKPVLRISPTKDAFNIYNFDLYMFPIIDAQSTI